MVRAVCSGSFDPVTLGHVDIFARASHMFDELTICVFRNIHKKGMFTIAERVAFLRTAVSGLPNVKVDAFSGLLTDYMVQHEASVIVRGVRSVKDLEYEQNEAYMNRHLQPGIDTIFLLTRPEFSFVSSSGIRELVHFGGSVEGLVPACVAEAVAARRAEQERE